MSKDCDDNKEYLCNVSLIKALVQFFPVSERKRVQEWLAKLNEIEDGMSDSKTRNEYSFYLLLNMQNGSLSQPFNKPPPNGKLRPLCRILEATNCSKQIPACHIYTVSKEEPDFLYEEVQKQLKVSYCRLNRMLNTNNDNYEMPDLRCEPSGFHGEQPRPRKGITATVAVFSNYEDEKK